LQGKSAERISGFVKNVAYLRKDQKTLQRPLPRNKTLKPETPGFRHARAVQIRELLLGRKGEVPRTHEAEVAHQTGQTPFRGVQHHQLSQLHPRRLRYGGNSTLIQLFRQMAKKLRLSEHFSELQLFVAEMAALAHDLGHSTLLVS
jgi:hypothetical protein